VSTQGEPLDDPKAGGPADEAKAPERINHAAGRRIEAVRIALADRRRALGLSMSDVARQIGVSPSMISQIERGQTLPSVGTLFALATALDTPVDSFLAVPSADPEPERGPKNGEGATEDEPPAGGVGGSRAPLYVVRRDQRAGVDIRGGVRWERLTPESLPDVDFLELIYEPYAQSDQSLYRHPGVEMVLVLEGQFVITVGFERYTLSPGDSIIFPSSLPHRYVNPTAERSRAVTTILHGGLDALAPGLLGPRDPSAGPATPPIRPRRERTSDGRDPG